MFAEIHHKAQVREDVLTSHVFGAYKHLPFRYGLGSLLQLLKERRDSCLDDFALETAKTVDVRFWPRMDNNTEPDAVCFPMESFCPLDAQHQPIAIVCIEAKLGSSMGYSEVENAREEDAPEGDVLEEEKEEAKQARTQLAKELNCMVHRTWSAIKHVKPFCPIALIYLTHHVIYPEATFKDVEDDEALCKQDADKIIWASWYDVFAAAEKALGKLQAEPPDMEYAFRSILNSLIDLLKDLEFTRFSGWSAENYAPPQVEWDYPIHDFAGWGASGDVLPEVCWSYPKG